MPEPLGAFDPTTTYDQAVREYEDASSEFLRYLSDHTLHLLDLQPGERVLDVPCGTGHAALPAAQQVGPTGRVVALDVSERMVQLVRAKATRQQLGNLEVHVADMARLAPPERPHDAVICVLGIFFMHDMADALRGLAGQLRPGGRMGVAVFGESFFEPLRTIFVDAVHRVAPDLDVIEPWARLDTERELRQLFDDAGLSELSVHERVDRVPLASPDDAWRLIMGSGLRSTITRLHAHDANEVRASCVTAMTDGQVTHLATVSRYAVAARI